MTARTLQGIINCKQVRDDFSIPPSGYNVSLFASTTQMIGSLVTTELGAYGGSFPIASFSEEMGRQTGIMTAVFPRLCLGGPRRGKVSTG